MPIYGQDKFIPNGCVLNMPLEGSVIARAGGPLDISGNGNNGTVYGRPVVSFDGVDDKVSIDTPFDSFGGNRYAVVAGWIYLETTALYKTVFTQDFSGGTEQLKILLESDNTFEIYVRGIVGDTQRTYRNVPAISLETWHSYIIAIDSTNNTVDIWVDGEVHVSAGALSGAISAFGADTPNYQAFGLLSDDVNDFKGKMKNLGILGTDTLPTLRDAEQFHEFPQVWLNAYGFDAFYRCNEGTGNLTDGSGNGHAATLTGATWDLTTNGADQYVNSGGAGDSFQPEGYYFDKTDDRLVIESSVINAFPFTLEAWVIPNNVVGDMNVFWIGRKELHTSYIELYTNADTVVVLNRNTALNVEAVAVAGLRGSLHHIACVFRDGGTEMFADVYVDGTLRDTLTNATWADSFFSDVTVNRTTFGGRGDASPSGPFGGSIKHVGLYNRQLTLPEIIALFEQGPN